MPDLPAGLYDELVTRQIEITNQLLDLLAGLDDAVGSGDQVTTERLLEVLRRDQVRLGAGELRRQRGFVGTVPDNAITRALPRLLHIDDLDRLTRWQSWLSEDRPPTPDPSDPYQLMLFAALGQAKRPLAELGAFFAELWSDRVVLDEVRQLLGVLDDRRRKTTHALPGLPFRVHATYSRDEISAGLVEARKGKLLRTQGGVFACEKHRCDVLYVTLEKDEHDFTPTTLYNDYPLSQRQFHWESQGITRLESDTGRRYRQPPEDWRILLFVRQAKKDERKLTMPYLFLGPVRCVSASGSDPSGSCGRWSIRCRRGGSTR